MGQKLAPAVQEYKVVDERTFQIVLKQKFGPLLEALGKPSVVVPFMMPKRVAETDPFKQIDSSIGSGPFIFKRDEWKPGEKLVFLKNPKYKPRSEPRTGLAGGKVVNVDRVEWVWIPDAETQLSALLKGEIDGIESVNYDHLPTLEKSKGIKVLVGKTSNQYGFRMNWLNPPFNNVKVRQAVAYALSQDDFLQASVGDNDLRPVQGDVHVRCAACLDRGHGRADRRQRGQGARTPEGGELRRHGRGIPQPPISASSSRWRRSPSRSSRKRASRSRSGDGLAEHGARLLAAGPPSEPRMERLRHGLVADSTSSIR
jgi:ABC-type transport system substrate-binding protein